MTSVEKSRNRDFEIVDMLSRHENGYFVFDRLAKPNNPELATHVIRTFVGINLDLHFTEIASSHRITPIIVVPKIELPIH